MAADGWALKVYIAGVSIAPTIAAGAIVFGAILGASAATAGDVIAATDRGKIVYCIDNQTTGLTSNGGTRSPEGRVAVTLRSSMNQPGRARPGSVA